MLLRQRRVFDSCYCDKSWSIKLLDIQHNPCIDVKTKLPFFFVSLITIYAFTLCCRVTPNRIAKAITLPDVLLSNILSTVMLWSGLSKWNNATIVSAGVFIHPNRCIFVHLFEYAAYVIFIVLLAITVFIKTKLN